MPLQRLVWGVPARLRAASLPERPEIAGEPVEALPLPGHSPDSTGFLVPGRGWLFAGDLYIASRPRCLRADEDLDARIASLGMALERDFAVVFCAHRGVPRDGRAGLAAMRGFLIELCERVAALHAEGRAAASVEAEAQRPVLAAHQEAEAAARRPQGVAQGDLTPQRAAGDRPRHHDLGALAAAVEDGELEVSAAPAGDHPVAVLVQLRSRPLALALEMTQQRAQVRVGGDVAVEVGHRQRGGEPRHPGAVEGDRQAAVVVVGDVEAQRPSRLAAGDRECAEQEQGEEQRD
jgi:hypothetical protein